MRKKETSSLDFSISVSPSNMLSFLSSFSLQHLNVGVPQDSVFGVILFFGSLIPPKC